MKILVVGAGNIGTIFGWAAAQNGHEVVHLLRPGRSALYRQGIDVDFLDQRAHKGLKSHFTYPIKTIESLDEQPHFDLVIVPTKHYNLIQTLEQLAPVTCKTDTLLLTQNWTGVAGLEPFLLADHAVFGDAKAGGSHHENKLVGTLKALDYGPIGSPAIACLKRCEEAFGPFVPLHLHENMLEYLWVQYAITGGLWPALVRAGSFKSLFSDSRHVEQAAKAVQDCLRIVEARGVDLEKFPEVKIYWHASPLVISAMSALMAWQFAHSEYQRRCSMHALADPIEVKAFYYDLVNAGRELGVSMPVMESYRADMEAFTQPGSAY